MDEIVAAATCISFAAHGQTLDVDGLRQTAVTALERDGRTQGALAADFGVSPPATSRALSGRVGTKDAGILRRIVALLTPFDVEDVTAPAYKLQSRQGE